jgi:hypothetical protein
MHYMHEQRNRDLTAQGAIARAVKQTAIDYFSFALRPEHDLITAVAKDGFLLSAMIARPGDASTGLKAIYGNWVLLGEALEGDKRKALVNPIVQGLFTVPATPAEYMQSVLEKYAQHYDMSSVGLSFDDTDEHSRHLAYEALFNEIDEFAATNLAEIFDEISASLLNINRPDRSFIVYKDKPVADAARAYLLAKSNTF